MNYDCDRPTSRVSKPPGGGSSNIFGDIEPIAKRSSCKSNPSFQSSLLSGTVSQQSNEAKQNLTLSLALDQPIFNDHITGSTQVSNIPMFTPEVRPHTASYTRGSGLERSSEIFKDFNYPTDIRFEPGVQCRPNTAYKSTNPTTVSNVFGNNKLQSNNFKKDRKKNLTFQSSVFTPQPKVAFIPKPASKTFETTVDKSETQGFVKRKLSTQSYSQSAMIGSTCDVPGGRTTILSSGFVKTALKPNGLKSFDLPKEKGNPLFKSNVDLITTSGDNVVHFKCQGKKQLNNSYKSDGYKNSNILSNKDSFKLWSGGSSPSQMNSGIGRNSESYKSNVFKTDGKYGKSCIWSSDFKKASIETKQVVSSNNTNSTVFLPPNPLVTKKPDHISKTYLSTIFT